MSKINLLKDFSNIQKKTIIIPELLNFMDDEQKFSKLGHSIVDFKIISEIGKGSFGVVYKAQSQINNQICAIKKIDLSNLKDKQQKESLNEVLLLKKLRHPNIIEYYTSFLENDNLFIVMEYAEGGDLQNIIRKYKDKKQKFSENEIWKFTIQMSQGLDYLHKKNIIHRDIKALNILLSKSRQIKIADLGVSKIQDKLGPLFQTKVGIFKNYQELLYIQHLNLQINNHMIKIQIYGQWVVFFII